MPYREKQVLERLVALRKEAGFTQKKVESELGLRSGTIYDYEKGRLKISLELAFRLSELYGVRLADIVEELEPNAAVQSVEQVSQLMQLNLVPGAKSAFLSALREDPIIVSEIGLEDISSGRPLVDLLLERLSENQKRLFLVDVYRYVNSLIGSDKKISSGEIELRNAILQNSPFQLDDRELSSIKRAFTQKFLGKSPEKSFPRDAYKHYLIWVLFIVGVSDGALKHMEKVYIEEVAEAIQLKYSSLQYIAQKINSEQQKIGE